MKVIIVAGCQRSGTTLTGQIIGAHSQGFFLDEYDKIYEWTNAWLTKAGNQTKLLNHSIKTASSKYSDDRKEINCVSDLHDRFLILKAPNISFYANQLSLLDDDIKIVYPIRDVRAVVASILKRKSSVMINNQISFFLNNEYIVNNFGMDMELLLNDKIAPHIKAAIIWKIKNLLVHCFEKKQLHPLQIKYEDIIENPILMAKRIAHFCQIGYEPSLVNHHHYMVGRGPGKTMRQRKVDSTSLKKWVNQLESKQIDEIMDVAGETMSAFKYN